MCCHSICQTDDNLIFIDIDIQSAHSHFAAKLAGEDSIINSLVTNKTIWKDKINDVRDQFLKHNIEDKIIKNIIKIGVYGTLNGGNPVGETILNENIIEEFFGNKEDNIKLELKKIIQNLFNTWDLIEELKSLNEKVTTDLSLTALTYSIDRIEPYMVDKIDKKHKAISRYLQGYEVVLLSILSYYVLYIGGLVVNLEHDGLLCLFIKKIKFKP